MDDLYQDHILDHFRNPRNTGSINQSSQGAQLTHMHVANAGCGDSIDADVLITEGKIRDLKWRGTGCAISQASMSMVSELVIGKTLEEVRVLGKTDLLELMGLSDIASTREKCLLLPLQIFLV